MCRNAFRHNVQNRRHLAGSPKHKDDDGEVIELSLNQITRILDKLGYRWGMDCKHHHVDKLSARNLLYRKRYLKHKKKNRDNDGLPIRPEIYAEESFCNLHHMRRAQWCWPPDKLCAAPLLEASDCLRLPPRGRESSQNDDRNSH